MSEHMRIDRRDFLRVSASGSLAIGIGSALPACFADAAAQSGSDQETVLVVVQLTGGNDGLNTVVPHANDAYYEAREKLAIPANRAIRVNDELGFHPSLASFAELLDDGLGCVVQGVGYDSPNRSHFESMDIWHTCRRKSEPRPDGWLGRCLDALDTERGGDVPALHLGDRQQPRALASLKTPVPTVRRLDEFRLKGESASMLPGLLQNQSASTDGSTELLDFLQSSTQSALDASGRVAQAAKDYRSDVRYPESALGKKLRIVAQLIDSGMSTRLYYVQLDGFDTHAQQAETHSILLREWGDAVSAFVRDLDQHSHAQRVSVMTFSEFGRRVAENASEGTDHGAAGPMLMCGGGLKSGFMGQHPELTDLQNGDLKHAIDFRQVYAAVLRDWLGTDPKPIVGANFKPLDLFG